jgi:hypothetical protein
MDLKKINFARSTLSNLIGGISYFTGKYTILEKKTTNFDVFFL